MKERTLIGYVRVSKLDQNPDRQFDELIKYGVDEKNIFGPDKVSGLKNKRSYYEDMLKHVRPDQDIVVVTELFRLGRSSLELLRVLDYFSKNNIHVKTLHENIDTSTKFGEWLFELFSVLGELEVIYNHERTRSGLKAIRKRKSLNKGGRPKRLDQKGEATLKKLYFNSEMSVSEILKFMNLPKSTFYGYVNQWKDEKEKAFGVSNEVRRKFK